MANLIGPKAAVPEGAHIAGRSREAIDLEAGDLERTTAALLADGYRLALIAGHDDSDRMRVVYLFTAGPPDRRLELRLRIDHDRPAVPSLAAVSFPASRFERELHDLFGIVPAGHPRPARLVLHQHWPDAWHPMRRDAGQAPPMTDESTPYPFLEVQGPGVYEIPVGPVHAGLIEPGHFRFSVVGETILTMKARLWFVHKGIERLFEGRDPHAGVELTERISGDTAVGHTLAYCLALEDAWRCDVPEPARALRALLLELERLYNHVADIGALCNDVGYGVANAHALRIRERLLRLNARVTGHRLLRGGVFPGGARVVELPSATDLEAIAADLREVVTIAMSNSTLVDRFTGTAVLTRDHAAEIGVLGYVARASGLALDARVAHPIHHVPARVHVPVHHGGDVLARFAVRVDEFEASVALITRLLDGAASAHVDAFDRPRPGDSGVGIVEGWRGSIVHRVEVGRDGRLTRVKIVDPSFLNWPALPIALADTIVPDFPLANKSFNLSYAGNDL
jgi:Ni,Fe-hydrogenase III large subunit/Ni,Fe-hydrogenase III component G